MCRARATPIAPFRPELRRRNAVPAALRTVMKLARKLTLALILGVFAVLASSGYVWLRRETSLFENDVRRDDHTMGRALSAAVLGVWRTEGEARALRIVDEANERESQVDIRWVWLDAPEGSRHEPMLPPEALAPLRRGGEVVRKIQRQGVDRLVTTLPVQVPDARVGALELSESLAGEQQYLRTTVLNTFAVTAGLTLVCGLITTWLGVWIVGRPMRRLIEQARRIGAGDLSHRLSQGAADEIGELALEMNRMCDRLTQAHDHLATETGARIEAMEQLRHAERLATVGKLASGIAHELGAPLQIVTGRARMLADGEVTADEAIANGRILVEQGQRMAQIIRQLLDFARPRAAEKVETNVSRIVEETVSLLAPLADRQRVEISTEMEPSVAAHVDPEQIRQALTNVVVNGIQAMPEGGKLRVGIRSERASRPSMRDRARNDGVRSAETDWVTLYVEDEGVGMDDSTRDHIFEPFFTTKPVGDGTGLGLAVAYGIVKDHGGWIDVRSEPGHGSRFDLHLPRQAAP